MAADSVVYYSPRGGEVSEVVQRFVSARGMRIERPDGPDGLVALINRSFPAAVVVDATGDGDALLPLCRELKRDAFTAIVPLVVIAPDERDELAADALAAGADDVIAEHHDEREADLRLDLAMRRAARDVAVHPTTRLPGTVQIERDIGERLQSGQLFGVCYADLDSFKEFNDRYGYNHGDRVILLLSRILRDMVRGLAPGGFVGHIGGDDFIFNVPLEYLEQVCDEIILLFDELIPYQYTEEDRKAGFFLGKDRRGSVHRVPLMTLSIGVVTNQGQPFTHTAQVSELAAEMKSYAKTLPGSVYVVDRRHKTTSLEPLETAPAAG
ncbi:MAG: GGDEF domain-containing protein [Gemmatimonadetes bacterium]|nr:MAG: GGDEF domain-containing protein [Gemmatimonadota bacterium]